MKTPTKCSHSTLLSTVTRNCCLFLFVTALALVAIGCGRLSQTEPVGATVEDTASSSPAETSDLAREDPRSVLKELQNGVARLDSYVVSFKITVLYHDGSTKEADGSAWFNNRAGKSQPNVGFSRDDPLSTKLGRRDGPWQGYDPRVVSYRQPGGWSSPFAVVGYLNRADDFTLVGETPTKDLSYYRVRFDERPDLDSSPSIHDFIGWSQIADLPDRDLMDEIYREVPLLADVWIDRDSAAIRRVVLVTRGMGYPADMEEPNDLKGAVEEQIVLTYTVSGTEPVETDEPFIW